MATPKEGSRDIGDGIIISLTPDVCKTPVGSSTPPIPYSVFAKQADDANTAATVRMTGKRAHNMGSVITKTQGDGPGASGGIKSGTVGAACHPKGHSGTVNIQGKPAVRHGDEWYMNNKNTVGKLTYVKSMETHKPTPAIELTHDPESQLPDGLDYSDTVSAIMGGMARAHAEGMPAGSYRVAQASPLAVPSSTPAPVVPNSTPTTTNISPHGAAANDNMRPRSNRIARSPARMAAFGRVLGLLGLAQAGYQLGDMAGRWYVGPDGVMGRRIGEVVGQEQVSVWSPQGQAIGRALGFPSFGAEAQIDYANNLLSLKAGQPVDFRTLQPDELEKLIENPWPDAETITANAEALPAQRQAQIEATQAESQLTSGNVRVEEDKKRRNSCNVQRYGSIKCETGEQAHHIVPDSVLRYGNRAEGEAGVKRIPGMPTFRDGMAICLSGNASDPTSGHGIAHSVTDPMIAAASLASPIARTTTLSVAKGAGIAGAIAAKPQCAAEITAAANAQFSAIDGDRLVNAANRPATGPALAALMTGQ